MSLLKDKDLVKYSNSSSQDSDTPSFDPNNVPYVDLGLSVYWYNGSIAGKYRWGETEQADSSTPYKFYVDGEYTKYTEESGKIVLDPEDDAAHKHLGGSWRMPTVEETYELKQNCRFEKIYDSGASDSTFEGFELISNINNNSITFTPDSFNFVDYTDRTVDGCYWTASLETNYNDPYGCVLLVYSADRFNKNKADINTDNAPREKFYPVLAVLDKEK